jgi:hypothetical protein
MATGSLASRSRRAGLPSVTAAGSAVSAGRDTKKVAAASA